MNLTIDLHQPAKRLALFGTTDRHLRMIREAMAVTIVARNDTLIISGERQQVSRAAAVIELLQKALTRRDYLAIDEVAAAIATVTDSDTQEKPGSIDVFVRGQAIRPKSEGQKKYLQAIFDHDLTLCSGPAGSGKTYLAVAAAAAMLKRGQTKRIVLARPAVEAGERLGFLPGDLAAKVNPYLRPLFDALHDMMDAEQVKRFMANDVIEVVPLAFMRGRTLSDAVVILDEAQNTTVAQMFMFLTRLGTDSKMIVTGDVSQIDLEDNVESGLVDAMSRLSRLPGIASIQLSRSDIVRHRLVQTIVDAYEPPSPHETPYLPEPPLPPKKNHPFPTLKKAPRTPPRAPTRSTTKKRS